MKSGIYQIQSLIHPDRVYIGSAKDLKLRIRTHKHRLNKGNHANYLLQAHCLKYGINDLVFSIVEHCPIGSLIKREQFYIDQFAPSFNICRIAGNTIGRPQSEETRRKRSESLKGRTCSPEHRRAMSEGRKKRHPPIEINHFLLLNEDTTTGIKDAKRHIYMCCVCGNIIRRPANELNCPCRRIHKVRVPKKYIPKQRIHRYNIIKKDNTSGYPGVTFDKVAGRYRARIRHKGKLLSAGSHSTPLQAHEARRAMIQAMQLPILQA